MEPFCQNYISNFWHCTKNEVVPLRIPSVNVTKSVVSCRFAADLLKQVSCRFCCRFPAGFAAGFLQIYWRNHQRKTSVFAQFELKSQLFEMTVYLLWPYNNLWTRKFYIWSFNQVKLPWSEWKSFHSKIEALHKKCPYPELFWSAFCPHFPATGLNTERYSISLQNVDQSNSENGHFLHSEDWSQFV